MYKNDVEKELRMNALSDLVSESEPLRLLPKHLEQIVTVDSRGASKSLRDYMSDRGLPKITELDYPTVKKIVLERLGDRPDNVLLHFSGLKGSYSKSELAAEVERDSEVGATVVVSQVNAVSYLQKLADERRIEVVPDAEALDAKTEYSC
jgi:hypothetical protein